MWIKERLPYPNEPCRPTNVSITVSDRDRPSRYHSRERLRTTAVEITNANSSSDPLPHCHQPIKLANSQSSNILLDHLGGLDSRFGIRRTDLEDHYREGRASTGSNQTNIYQLNLAPGPLVEVGQGEGYGLTEWFFNGMTLEDRFPIPALFRIRNDPRLG